MKKQISLDRSKELRKKQTPTETIIWNHLRNRELKDFKFRRQHVIEPYIVEFVCFQLNLIIEIDGGQHMDAVDYDQKRDSFLKSKGFKILRYWNNDVYNNIEGVLEDIWLNLKQ